MFSSIVLCSSSGYCCCSSSTSCSCLLCVDSVIALTDQSVVVTSASFINVMERRLASVFSFAMSSSSLSIRHRRAATFHNATVQVVLLLTGSTLCLRKKNCASVIF